MTTVEFFRMDVGTFRLKRRQRASVYLQRGLWLFDFNHFEPKAPTAKVRAESERTYCHIAGAKKHQVWTQFYRLLDE